MQKKRDTRFLEAAMQELAQGRFANNESIPFIELPEFLMEDAEWAWLAGYHAGYKDANKDREQIKGT